MDLKENFDQGMNSFTRVDLSRVVPMKTRVVMVVKSSSVSNLDLYNKLADEPRNVNKTRALIS